MPMNDAVETLLDDIKKFYSDKEVTMEWIDEIRHMSIVEVIQGHASNNYNLFMEENEHYLCRLAYWHLTEPAFKWPEPFGIPGSNKMCDFGAGIGTRGIQHILYGWDVDFVEINKHMRKFIKFRLAENELSGRVLKNIHNDTKYNFILCCDVIGHLSDPTKTMTDAIGALLPGGIIHITEDNLIQDEQHINYDFDFYSLYDELGIERLDEYKWIKKPH